MASTGIGTLGHPHPSETFFKNSNFVNAQDLAASSAVSLTFPTVAGARFCRLSANLDIYVMWGSTGVSTAAAGTGGGSVIIPVQSGGRVFDIASTLNTTAASIMSTGVAHVTSEWWAA